jgi:hypothetical protein
VALARQVGNRETEASCELWLGVADFDAGQMAAAERRLNRSLEICRDAADKRGEAHAMSWLGRIDLAAGKLPVARARLVDSLQALRQLEMRAELLECLDDMAWLSHVLGDGATAAGLARAVEAARQRLGLRRSPRRQRHWEIRGGRWIGQVILDPSAAGHAPHDPAAQPAWDLSEAVSRSLQLAGQS